MDDKTMGLYGKFNVSRVDGSSEPGGKHDGCDYFVLDLTHDKHAPAALRAYAESCAAEYPLLAADLLAKLPTSAALESLGEPVAKPLQWDDDGEGQWTDKHCGFWLYHDAEETPTPYRAAWGEGDSECFETLEAAQAWCQTEIDRWVGKIARPTADCVGELPTLLRDFLAIAEEEYGHYPENTNGRKWIEAARAALAPVPEPTSLQFPPRWPLDSVSSGTVSTCGCWSAESFKNGELQRAEWKCPTHRAPNTTEPTPK